MPAVLGAQVVAGGVEQVAVEENRRARLHLAVDQLEARAGGVDALALPERFGVWGGLGEKERSVLLREGPPVGVGA